MRERTEEQNNGGGAPAFIVFSLGDVHCSGRYTESAVEVET